MAAPAAAQTFPELTGRVVDAANILPPETEARIAQQSEAVEQHSGSQLVVATIPDLQGYPIEDYGYRLGRHWGIGQKDKDNGVILIVAPNERRVRIEVGYGLEPVLTDALSSVIIQQQVLPRFRAGDMPGGVLAGFQAIANQFELPSAQAAANVQRAAQMAQQPQPQGVGFGTVIFLIFMALWLWMAFRPGKRGKRGRRGVAPMVIWGPGMGGWGGGGGFGGGGFGGGFGGGGGGFGGGGASGGW